MLKLYHSWGNLGYGLQDQWKYKIDTVSHLKVGSNKVTETAEVLSSIVNSDTFTLHLILPREPVVLCHIAISLVHILFAGAVNT